MSFFRNHLDDMTTEVERFRNGEKKDLHDMKGKIDRHVVAVKAEFQMDRKEFQELVRYNELMKQIKTKLNASDYFGRLNKKVHQKDFDTYVDEIEEKLKEAHTLIFDVEKLIRKEFGTAHKFLE